MGRKCLLLLLNKEREDVDNGFSCFDMRDVTEWDFSIRRYGSRVRTEMASDDNGCYRYLFIIDLRWQGRW